MKIYVYFVTISYYIKEPFVESAYKERSMCEISTPELIDSIEKWKEIITEIKKKHPLYDSTKKVIIDFYSLLRIEEIPESTKSEIKVKFMN